MMKPPIGMLEEIVAVNINVILVLNCARSDALMKNLVFSKAAMDITGSVEVDICSPPTALAAANIVNPEHVTVIDPRGTEAAVVITMLPFLMNDVEAGRDGEDISHAPVLPMYGK